MRTLLIISFFSFLIFMLPSAAEAQIKVDLKSKINREANRRANQKADEAVNAGFNKAEEGIKNVITGKEKTGEGEENKGNPQEASDKQDETGNNTGQNARTDAAAAREVSLSWSKYDFVPGDAVIFEDNLLNEENGEFLSRWDLVRGNVEIAKVDGENVIMMREGAPSIVPYLKNPGIKFNVEGHTDSQGDYAFNLKLSEERAQAVMNTLVKMGIATERLSSKGWGESKPISNNASPEDMANNRRVEFVKI